MTGPAASKPCASPKACQPGAFPTSSRKGSMCVELTVSHESVVYMAVTTAQEVHSERIHETCQRFDNLGRKLQGSLSCFRPAYKESTLYTCDLSRGNRIMQAYKRTNPVYHYHVKKCRVHVSAALLRTINA